MVFNTSSERHVVMSNPSPAPIKILSHLEEYAAVLLQNKGVANENSREITKVKTDTSSEIQGQLMGARGK